MRVFYEEYSRVISAKMLEKEIKGWRREWQDLSLEWEGEPGWEPIPEARPRLKRKTPTA
jgi:hypothetical protein